MSAAFLTRLRAVLSPQAFADLVADFAGQRIYIPAATGSHHAERDAALYAEWRKGRHPAELARDYVISEEHARQIIQRQHSGISPETARSAPDSPCGGE